jgi:thiol:disulfide interchange protein DsbA
VFKAIHPAPGERHYDLLFAQGDEAESTKLQRKFLMANGVSGEDFDKARNSFSLATNLKKADALLRRYNEIYEVGTVPSIVINGKYLTDVGSAGGHPQLLQLINDLAASEKRP